MTGEEAKSRVETLHWVAHTALLSYSRYKNILNDESTFRTIFPDVDFKNPKIIHDTGSGHAFYSTKNELLAIENSNLFIGWQVILGLSGMTSIFDIYLKSKTDELTHKENKVIGIFKRFQEDTGINIKQQSFYNELRKYHHVRDISLHNLGKINQRFVNETNSPKLVIGHPYVYYPSDINTYKDTLMDAIEFVEDEYLLRIQEQSLK